VKEERKAIPTDMRKEGIWLARTSVRMKKKHATPRLKKESLLVEKKGSRVRKMRRNERTKTVGEKGTKPDWKKAGRNGRLTTSSRIQKGRHTARQRRGVTGRRTTVRASAPPRRCRRPEL
jgi:hypothetical protein